MNVLMKSKEFFMLVVEIEYFFTGLGELTAMDEVVPDFDPKDYRIEGYDPDTGEACFYYQRAKLLASVLSAQSDFFDDCTAVRFDSFLDLFKTKGD